MGKRKERRLAAISAAGRRVKLDLFTEPDGDMGGSARDEVGGDEDSKNRAGLPKSPSSSGQIRENSLLLLEQYSDDELDGNEIAEEHLADLDDQVKIAGGKELEGETSPGEGISVQNAGPLDMENGALSSHVSGKVTENGSTGSVVESGGLQTEIGLTEHLSVLATSDARAGDVSSDWKIVLHDESNRYYYWNTVTSETSWELPDVLAEGTESTGEMKLMTEFGGTDNVVTGTHKSSLTLIAEMDNAVGTLTSDVFTAVNSNCQTKEIYEHRPEIRVPNEEYCDNPNSHKGDQDADKIVVKSGHTLLSSPHKEASSHGGHICHGSDEAHIVDWSVSGSNIEKCTDNARSQEEDDAWTCLTSRLVTYCELLLERLRSLKGSRCHLDGHEQLSKYILEVEIRLSDINSLLCHGSALLPFWLHSEKQLKQLETFISDLQLYSSAQQSETDAKYKPHRSICDDVNIDANEKAVYCDSEVEKDSHKEPLNDGALNTEDVLLENNDSMACSGSGAGQKDEVHGVAMLAESTHDIFPYSGEDDIDMDVDMEVEEAPLSNVSVGDTLSAQCHAPAKEPIVSNLTVGQDSLMFKGRIHVPPPPNEAWIPPPPPDSEPFLPPPPDEPPEPSYPPPPPDSEAVNTFSYTGQFNLPYPGSSFEYYGQVNTDVPGSSLYPQAEGCEVPASHLSLYYAVPNAYHSTTPVVVNPVEHVTFYGFPDATPPPVPIVSNGDSFGFQNNFDEKSLGSDQNGFVKTNLELVLPDTKVDISSVGGIQIASSEVASAVVSVQPQVTISLEESIPVSSTPAGPSTVSVETVPKAPPKVTRTKKRVAAAVPTLRSNKKVSSLVDKWKAAKEELHEDEEDESDNAYEMLEKKRRREIEEWYAQQIATGEAKDNANFQPLGGDWRERVKRKRGKLANETVKTTSDGVTDGNKQPDLNKLSRDLPSGWQAYWDDSSKQVYYGNVFTSETTWVKPEK